VIQRRGAAALPPYTKATQAVSGKHAWNPVGENPPGPALAAVDDRLYQFWMTPHGFIKAAAKFNLYENIERLKLTVDTILPLHGRKVPLSELQKWIGRAS
jgi:hypothetical protein